MDTHIANIYLVQHRGSESQAKIECMFDENHKPRVSSTKMLSGNIIPLSSVREALNHFNEEHGSQNEKPDQPA